MKFSHLILGAMLGAGVLALATQPGLAQAKPKEAPSSQNQKADLKKQRPDKKHEDRNDRQKSGQKSKGQKQSFPDRRDGGDYHYSRDKIRDMAKARHMAGYKPPPPGIRKNLMPGQPPLPVTAPSGQPTICSGSAANSQPVSPEPPLFPHKNKLPLF